MLHPLKIGMAQINPIVGDLQYNFSQICKYIEQANAAHALDILLFPELALSGYPPEDLLFREGFVTEVARYLEQVSQRTNQCAVIVGYPRQEDGIMYNSVAVMFQGRLVHQYDKRVLPNYGVFDEKRYFAQGQLPAVIKIHDVNIGLSICEDIWQVEPTKVLSDAGADIILNLNASPFHINKIQQRQEILKQRCSESGLPIVYVNMVGGQDELVFDGHSMAMNASGQIVYQAPGYIEHLGVVQFEKDIHEISACPSTELLSLEAQVYATLVLAIRDYVHKNGFDGVVLGLSGGVDSALTLALAVDALGSDQVEAVMMPSRYTSQMSLDDAVKIATNFSVAYSEISIEPIFESFLQSLKTSFTDYPGIDVTEENIQARCRGVLLMAISNKKRKLLLTTGNKSELAVGYATLYGDMAGGFAPLKDVSKTMVYKLCQYRNRDAEYIPARIITRPPSAELAAEQKDSDSLPEYAELDAILEHYLEHERSLEFIVEQGFAKATVEDVIAKVNRNEYKRRQAAPGVKITQRAFGRERRYPITNGYR